MNTKPMSNQINLFESLGNILRPEQVEITTTSPINVEGLSRQNKTVFKLLMENQKVNMRDCMKHLVGTPHSRFADVREWLHDKHGISLRDRMIRLGDTNMKEYWIEDQDKRKLRSKSVEACV